MRIFAICVSVPFMIGVISILALCAVIESMMSGEEFVFPNIGKIR